MTYIGTTDIIVFSHLRFSGIYQRPHHLMKLFSATAKVCWFEEPIFVAEGANGLREVRHNDILVVTPVINMAESNPAEILKALLERMMADCGINKYISWYYTPMALEFSRGLSPNLIVFDIMDELSAFKFAPAEMKTLEAELVHQADVIFTGGQSLQQSKIDAYPHLAQKIHCFPSGVDKPFFATARKPLPEPSDMDSIPHPRFIYTGAIDERLDYDLLAQIASTKPDWHFVMIGSVVKVREDELPQLPNIHFLGLKSYSDLPSYLSNSDIAIMPFAHNESTRSISPTKTPEYLAAGKPVISTRVNDVVSSHSGGKYLWFAETAKDFISKAESLLKENSSKTKKRLAEIDSVLSGTSWDSIQGQMRDEIINAQIAKEQTMYDYMIVGAGFAGAIMAERLASINCKVLICDNRSHIGGNAYDYRNSDGLLVHKYGPHIFHTNSEKVFSYLSQFTEWRFYEHRVLSKVKDKHFQFPINRTTINQFFEINLQTDKETKEFLARKSEQFSTIKNSQEYLLSKVGKELYEAFFEGYTRKQWGVNAIELKPSVAARVPARFSNDDRYFTDKYQYMPKDGYTQMFERMLSSGNITVALGIDFRKISIPYKKMVYTGPVDAFFNYRYGKLPYRSLQFILTTIDKECYQEAAVVNFPGDVPYTRITEFKYLTGERNKKTTIVHEYPQSEGEPYYPIPTSQSAALYAKYKALADSQTNVIFLGRLGTYQYYNMDQVVAQALNAFEKMYSEQRTAKVSA